MLHFMQLLDARDFDSNKFVDGVGGGIYEEIPLTLSNLLAFRRSSLPPTLS